VTGGGIEGEKGQVDCRLTRELGGGRRGSSIREEGGPKSWIEACNKKRLRKQMPDKKDSIMGEGGTSKLPRSRVVKGKKVEKN